MMGSMMGDKPALNETTALIIDEYRRMEIVRKARIMNCVACFATVSGSALILILAYITQPILYPSPEFPKCPQDDAGVRCSGSGTCMTGNVLVAADANCTTALCYCKCNLDRVGESCGQFDLGMPFSIFFIFAFLMQSVTSLVKSYFSPDVKTLSVGD
jgi:hypothetical protein